MDSCLSTVNDVPSESFSVLPKYEGRMKHGNGNGTFVLGNYYGKCFVITKPQYYFYQLPL